jgi:hypothetical protein
MAKKLNRILKSRNGASAEVLVGKKPEGKFGKIAWNDLTPQSGDLSTSKKFVIPKPTSLQF